MKAPKIRSAADSPNVALTVAINMPNGRVRKGNPLGLLAFLPADFSYPVFAASAARLTRQTFFPSFDLSAIPAWARVGARFLGRGEPRGRSRLSATRGGASSTRRRT